GGIELSAESGSPPLRPPEIRPANAVPAGSAPGHVTSYVGHSADAPTRFAVPPARAAAPYVPEEGGELQAEGQRPVPPRADVREAGATPHAGSASLTDLDEPVPRAQGARHDTEPGLLADRLDDEDGVRVLELDARGVTPRFQRAPDVVAERTLDGGRVEAALQTTALEADEEGPAGEAVDERLGGRGERRDGRLRL